MTGSSSSPATSGRPGPDGNGPVAGADTDVPVELVDEPGRLAGALASLDAPVVGLDVERDDSDSYHRRPALIQVGSDRRCLLIDPLGITDLGALDRFLAERTTVLHSLKNDLEPLEAVGVHLRTGGSGGRRRVEDTQVAAALLGLPRGLDSLLTDELGVRLSADKDRYQRAAWERRPLTDGMIRYAAGDVVHLPRLWTRLAARLEAQGRGAWYGQELRATAAAARGESREWTDTAGAGRLDPDERAVLRALWREREAIAVEHDIAPQVLVRDSTLVALAEDPADRAAGIVRRDERRGDLEEHASQLLEAQRRGLEADPVDDDRGPGRTPAQRDAHDDMRRVRNNRAEELGLDPGVLCPNRQLWAAVDGDPDSADELVSAGRLRPWQASLLADELWQAYDKRVGRAD